MFLVEFPKEMKHIPVVHQPLPNNFDLFKNSVKLTKEQRSERFYGLQKSIDEHQKYVLSCLF